MWVLSISIAIGEVFVLCVICSLLFWLFQLLNPPRIAEAYALPDEFGSYQASQEPPSKGRPNMQQFHLPTYNMSQPASKQQMLTIGQSTDPQPNTSPSWHNVGYPTQLTIPTMTTGFAGGPATNLYGHPVMVHTVSPTTGYKTLQTSYPLQTNFHNQPTVHHTGAGGGQVTYHQQTTGFQAAKPTTTKKVGSSESTGSSYYQQLMKNKGEVKSISQYGELLEQKKAGTKNKQK